MAIKHLTESDLPIGKGWYVKENLTINVEQPIRITKKDLSASHKTDFWENRLQKRESKLNSGIESWTKKYGEDKTLWPENIQEKAQWREQLVTSAKNRIDVWQEASKIAGEKIQTLLGSQSNSCEGIVIYQPELLKDSEKKLILDGNGKTQRTGKNIYYTIKPHGPYGAPKIIEIGAETGQPTGSILPTIFIDTDNCSQIYVLTEKDPDSQLQTGVEQRRAVRASKDNIITGELVEKATQPDTTITPLVPGAVRETGKNKLTNAARIVGFVRTGGVILYGKPAEQLLDPVITPEDKVGLKAISIEEYAKEADLPGMGAVLLLMVDAMKNNEIKISAVMPDVRKQS